MVFSEVLLAIGLGVLAGIFTGITPGIHVNLVSVIVVSLAPMLLQYTTAAVLGVFIISLAIIHTFLDAIPSVYLGAPDAGQELNVLPGHRLLLKGEGHNAVLYTIVGSLGSLGLGFLLFPLFIFGMTALQPIVGAIVGYVLILLVVYMVFREKKKWLYCATAFLLSGVLGLLVFTIPNLHQPLFPLLSGLFGFSLLIMSLSESTTIPAQDTTKKMTLSTKNMVKSVGAGTGMGFVAAFLPGFGSSQAAIIATEFVGDIGDEGFLSLVSGLNTANMLLSIAAVYAIEKARNGAIVAINQLIGGVGFDEMMLFLGTALVAGGIGAVITIYGSKIFSKLIVRVNYRYLVYGILGFITVLTIYFDGWLGVVILATATAIGLLTSVWGIAKNHLMGCLLLPVILYFVL